MTELEPEKKRVKLPRIGVELYEHYPSMSAQTHEAAVKQYAREALSSAQSAIAERDARIAELERDVRIAVEQRNMTLTEMQRHMDRAEAAEALLKEAGKVLDRFARLDKNYSGSNPGDAVFAKGCVYVCDLRAARSLMSKIGERNG